MKRKEIKGLLKIIVAFLVVTVFLGTGSEAYAKKDGFKQFTWQDVQYGKVVKAGGYSFKVMNNHTYYKKTKSSGDFKVAPFTITSSCTDGKVVYYVDKMVLKRFTLASGKVSSLKKIPRSPKEASFEPDVASVDHVKGNNVYICRSSWGEWSYRTFIYNKKSKKLTKSFAGSIALVKGKYMLLDMKFKSDLSTSPYLLCKISGSKLKKVKQLSKASIGVDLVGKKFYYLEYADKKTGDGYYYYGMKAGTLYRCNVDGSKKEKLGSFKCSGNYAMVSVSEVTSKDCKVMVDGVNYRYNYKTKKKTRLSN